MKDERFVQFKRKETSVEEEEEKLEQAGGKVSAASVRGEKVPLNSGGVKIKMSHKTEAKKKK